MWTKKISLCLPTIVYRLKNPIVLAGLIKWDKICQTRWIRNGSYNGKNEGINKSESETEATMVKAKESWR